MDFKPYLQEISLNRGIIPSYSEYPLNIPSIKNLPTMKFHRDVTFIVGENGSGKSTFIEALAQWLGMSKEGGSLHSKVPERDNSQLSQYLQGSKSYRRPKDYFFLRAESVYNVATYLDDTYGKNLDFLKNYGVQSLHECSHGESFLAIMGNRLGENGLYLFDEPESALSPMRQLTALSVIHQLVQKGSQLIIATHSPILLSYPNALIYQFDDSGVTTLNYEETEHFRVTKSFLDNYENSLKILLDN